MRSRAWVLGVGFWVLGAGLAVAGDRDFDSLVRGIETDYRVSRTRIPFMGMVNFFVKASHPAGGADLRLALFEDSRLQNLDQAVERRLAPGWRPFIRVISRGRETTAIYANPSENHLKVLIATMEPHEATLVQVRLSRRALEQWFADPVGRVRGH